MYAAEEGTTEHEGIFEKYLTAEGERTMKKRQWSDIYGETPISFQMKVENTLKRLEEPEMKKRYSFSMILVAAVLIVLLAGTAVAMGYSHIMEYFERGQIQPLDGAEELIQTNFGTQELEETPIQIIIEESVFDGNTAVVQLLISPTNPEEHALLNMGIQDYPESVYDLEITDRSNGNQSIRVVRRKDGKEIINYSVSLRQADENAAYTFGMDTLDAEELENGSVRVWLEGKVIEGFANQIELIVSGKYDFLNELSKESSMGYTYSYSKEIVLNNPNRTITAKLMPVDNMGGERFEIMSAWLEYSPLIGQLTVEYAYDPDLNNEPMGIEFRLYDADGMRIAARSGSETYLGTREDSWELLRLKDEVQSFEQFPERVYLEAKVIGEDKTLGRVECLVTEVEAVESVLDEMTAVREEKYPSFLKLEPNGSWEGEKICLLGGTLRTGRNVELMFTYKGDYKELIGLKVEYKWQDGSLFGTAVKSAGTINDDYIVLNQVLDGNIWPNSMVLEFTLNGEVIDSFECTNTAVWEEE